MRTWLLFALAACSVDPDPLGGQEGEPYDPPPSAPAPQAPPAEPGIDADNGMGTCTVAAHCLGEGWCVEYSADTAPDLEATCPGHWAEGPCDTTDAIGTCPWGSDLCTVIWIYDVAVDGVCEDG